MKQEETMYRARLQNVIESLLNTGVKWELLTLQSHDMARPAWKEHAILGLAEERMEDGVKAVLTHVVYDGGSNRWVRMVLEVRVNTLVRVKYMFGSSQLVDLSTTHEVREQYGVPLTGLRSCQELCRDLTDYVDTQRKRAKRESAKGLLGVYYRFIWRNLPEPCHMDLGEQQALAQTLLGFHRARLGVMTVSAELRGKFPVDTPFMDVERQRALRAFSVLTTWYDLPSKGVKAVLKITVFLDKTVLVTWDEVTGSEEAYGENLATIYVPQEWQSGLEPRQPWDVFLLHMAQYEMNRQECEQMISLMVNPEA